MMNKIEYRKIAKKILKIKNRKVLNDIINSNILIDMDIIGIYFPLKNEYDILGLMNKYPDKTFAFPRVISKSEMVFIKAKNVNDFEKAAFDGYEPKLVKNNIIPVNNFDIFIVPCIACSNSKRIGFGAGYYDKYLSNFKGKIVGVVNKKAINNDVVMSGHDISLEHIFEGD